MVALGPFSSDVLIGGGNSGTDCVRRRSCAENGAIEVEEEAERGRFRDGGVDEGDGDGAGEGGVQAERASALGDAVNDGNSFSHDSGRGLRACGAAGCCGGAESAVAVGRDGA